MLITALVLGFAGSLHCLGMCSPLAMTITNLRKPYFGNRMVYNGGRILCYGILGALVGAFGSLLSFSGTQTTLTIVLGGVLILIGLTGLGQFRIPLITGGMHRLSLQIKRNFAGFLQRKTIFSMAVLGMLNGLLPCGLTYLALTYCLSLESFTQGFIFMLLFGLGTLPVMLGFTGLLQSIINRFNFNFRYLATATLITVGFLLITRSISLHHDHPVVPSSNEIVICK